MNNLKSAPSPWEPDFSDIREVTVCDADGQIILQCLVTDGDPIWGEREITREEAEVNAYLAAAAPDMYAELERIEDILEDPEDCGEISLDRINAILRKARGEK